MGNVLQPKSEEAPKSKSQILSGVDIQVSRHHNCNNSNNTKVTEDPYPLNKPNTASQGDSLQPPERDLKAPADDTSPTSSEEVADKSVIKQAWKLEVGKPASGKKQSGVATSPSSISGVISVKSAVFEKWAAIDREFQRPLAKRQLSDESKACTVSRVKKSAARRDPTEGQQTPHADTAQTRQTESSGPQLAGNAQVTHRKLQRELFSTTDVFRKVDAHAIKAGKEVRKKKDIKIGPYVYVEKHLCMYTTYHKTHFANDLQLRSKKIYSVQMITQAITEGAQTELQKLRAIWTWLCHNIGLCLLPVFLFTVY